MRKYSTQFDRLPVGTTFSKNGNKWLKKSSRTAEIIKPEEYKNTWFYFGKNEQVIIQENQYNFLKPTKKGFLLR